jgi:hypothetical protein
MTQLEYDTAYAALKAQLAMYEVSMNARRYADYDAYYRACETLERWFEVAVDSLDKRLMSEDA